MASVPELKFSQLGCHASSPLGVFSNAEQSNGTKSQIAENMTRSAPENSMVINQQ